MVHSLGSRTSGVDGSSEGGRINTISIPGALVLYGVALLQALQRGSPKARLGAGPVLVDGIWCLEVTYDPEPPAGLPGRWHGHRVVSRKADPPPPPPPPPAPAPPAKKSG